MVYYFYYIFSNVSVLSQSSNNGKNPNRKVIPEMDKKNQLGIPNNNSSLFTPQTKRLKLFFAPTLFTTFPIFRESTPTEGANENNKKKWTMFWFHPLLAAPLSRVSRYFSQQKKNHQLSRTQTFAGNFRQQTTRSARESIILGRGKKRKTRERGADRTV